MAKQEKQEKLVEVDRGMGSVIFLKGVKPAKSGDPIYKSPAKNVFPDDDTREKGVNAADHYLYVKKEENTATEEDIRKGIFAAAFFMGMSAMAALCWILGYFNIGV